MGIYVSRFEHIYRAIEMVPPEGRLFCFFAIDDRPSHKEFFRFVENSAHWIDHLSALSRIYSFLPASRWSAVKNPPGFMDAEAFRSFEEEDFLSTFEIHDCYMNPSLLLASKFGIKPRELPGIVIFKAVPDSRPQLSRRRMSDIQNPLFIPLDAAQFNDQPRFETMIAELFSQVQEAWEGTETIDAVLNVIGAQLPEIAKNVRAVYVPSKNFRAILNEAEDAAIVYAEKENSQYPYLPDHERRSVKLFISYAREDEKPARLLYHRLREAGFSPWMDKYDILPGENWDNAIQRGLKESDFFVACLSMNSTHKRGYFQREFRFALDKWREHLENDIYILPIRFDDCDVPAELAAFQWLDMHFTFSESFSDRVASGNAGWGRIMQSITEGVRRRHTTG